MQTHVRNLAVVTGLALFSSAALSAQNASRETATVPFAFHAAGTTLPAGRYSIALNNNLGIVQIADMATGRSILVGTRSRFADHNVAPRLTFHRYGSEYFLSEIWMPDQANGYRLGPSAREKEMSRQSGPLTLASIRLAK